MTSENGKGVICLHNIPHGFYENEMRSYFSQFGDVTRIRLSRSRKTGNSREYAYIEFECDEVAKIAAETMNNYLMFGKLMKCEFMAPHKLHPKLFKNWDKKEVNTVARHKSAVNRMKSTGADKIILKRKLQVLKKSQDRLNQFNVCFTPVVINDPRVNSLNGSAKISEMSDDVEDEAPLATKKSKKRKLKAAETDVSPDVLKVKRGVPKAVSPEPTVPESLVVKKKKKSSLVVSPVVESPIVKKKNKKAKAPVAVTPVNSVGKKKIEKKTSGPVIIKESPKVIKPKKKSPAVKLDVRTIQLETSGAKKRKTTKPLTDHKKMKSPVGGKKRLRSATLA